VGMKNLDSPSRQFSTRGVDGRPELAEFSFWVINRDDETAWSYGPNKGY
jgi:hypothetical protein